MVPLNFYQLLEGHKREQAFFCNSPAKINLRYVIFNHGNKNKQALWYRKALLAIDLLVLRISQHAANNFKPVVRRECWQKENGMGAQQATLLFPRPSTADIFLLDNDLEGIEREKKTSLVKSY